MGGNDSDFDSKMAAEGKLPHVLRPRPRFAAQSEPSP